LTARINIKVCCPITRSATKTNVTSILQHHLRQ